ncbi:hypothetical protein [Chitinophaga sp.]|uniref:hypothetical protein n=1 Tax=Chitinophaga sp. TaxID=1869181 RepID=UPI0031D9CAF5
MVLAIYVYGFVYLMLQFPDIKIAREGKVVQMKITEISGHCITTKAKYYMKLSYQGRIFDKQIGVRFCEDHAVGDLINMRYLEGYDKLLFPTDDGKSEFWSGIGLGVLGLVAIIYFFKFKVGV